MFDFLRRKYPFEVNLIHNAKIVFFVSVILGIFLYIFQPFDLYSFPAKQRFIIAFLIAIITFSVLAFNLLVLPSYFSKVFNSKNWTVWKEILWNLWLILSVAVAYVVFFNFMDIKALRGVLVLKVILLSIIPVSLLVMFNQNRLLRLNLKDAVEMNRRLLHKLRGYKEYITLRSEYNESLTVEPEKIIAIKAAGNYIEVFYEHDFEVKKKMLRMTLKNVQEKLAKYSFIYKTHRSFLVNINFITEAEGNSQGIHLTLRLLDFKVPVSRNYIPGLKGLL